MKADREKQAGCGGSKEMKLALLQGVPSPLKGVGKERTPGFDWMLKLKDVRDQLEILCRRKYVCCAQGSGLATRRCCAHEAGANV